MAAIPIASAFIAAHEGCRLDAYQDSVGIWTIGYGHTGNDVRAGIVWVQAQADAQLAADLATVASHVANIAKRSLTDQQTAALLSFAFNLGVGALSTSTLLSLVNAGQFLAAAHEFPKWAHAGGVEVRGLLIRRLEEAALFLKGS